MHCMLRLKLVSFFPSHFHHRIFCSQKCPQSSVKSFYRIWLMIVTCTNFNLYIQQSHHKNNWIVTKFKSLITPNHRLILCFIIVVRTVLADLSRKGTAESFLENLSMCVKIYLLFTDNVKGTRSMHKRSLTFLACPRRFHIFQINFSMKTVFCEQESWTLAPSRSVENFLYLLQCVLYSPVFECMYC